MGEIIYGISKGYKYTHTHTHTETDVHGEYESRRKHTHKIDLQGITTYREIYDNKEREARKE